MKTRSFCFFLFCLAGLIADRAVVAQQPAPTAPPVPQSAPATLDSVLKWDRERIEQAVVNGTPEAQFTFNLTNVSSEVVTITAVTTSCGCTVAKLPEQPWHLAPGSNGQVSATMNLAGKSGTTVKTLTVMTENNKWAPKVLFVQTTIMPAAASEMTSADREANQNLAKVDRQAVFKGDCARCHVEPTKNLFGVQLYEKACGICHESDHRATMVADLHKLPHETNADFWRNWITHGKSDSLMPAFAIEEGGILSREQIESLVSYLNVAIPSKPGLPPAPKPTASLK